MRSTYASGPRHADPVEQIRTRLRLAFAVLATMLATGIALQQGTARAAPSIIPVGCGHVNGPHGLIAAINTANATPTPQTISLAAGCTYTLTTAQPALCCSAGEQDGLPPITGRVTILGNGTAQGGGATIARNRGSSPAFRILEVAPGGRLTLDGLNVTFGNALTGGGIYNPKGGTLSVHTTAILANNATAGHGGGVQNAGTAMITNSRVQGNTVEAFQSDQGAFGGGIDSTGILRVKTTSVANNKVLASTLSNGLAEGGGISNRGPMTMTSSTVSGNIVETDTATGLAAGAGIQTSPSAGKSTLNQTSITGNAGTAPGGGSVRGAGIILEAGRLIINGGGVEGNNASGANADGGGIYVTAGMVTLEGGALVTNNTPDNCDPIAITGCTG